MPIMTQQYLTVVYIICTGLRNRGAMPPQFRRLWCVTGGLELSFGIINPRRACAARVTVLGLCVCLHLFSPYRDQAGSSAIPTALAQQGLEKVCGDFA